VSEIHSSKVNPSEVGCNQIFDVAILTRTSVVCPKDVLVGTKYCVPGILTKRFSGSRNGPDLAELHVGQQRFTEYLDEYYKKRQ
jgi:hypothetical protein